MSRKSWIKNIIWVAALIYCVERGWWHYFILASLTLTCILYHKKIWDFMWVGGNLYADSCESLSDKILSKLRRTNEGIQAKNESLRKHTEFLKECKKKEKK